MKAGREFDILISTEVLGHTIHKQESSYFEVTSEGIRPLRAYSAQMDAAWDVIQSQGITLIPIEGGLWFAFAGPGGGWRSPAEFLECLQKGEFVNSGAAVSESAPLSACLAAWNKTQKNIEVGAIKAPHLSLLS
jgi:hypothetical protein